ncbi:tetratricopeptide repeat protein [Spirochaetes bacterium]|uniref:Tetratricopeptide repeat protein n=1 Tax=Candidatus Scatousia excrementipullorum TaxID=2840936 RepID=A0A9D9DN90_9BACT|nr:tetratricopeptide repeat protein [Candidatus Scatousia excrementipullorum]
MKKLLITLLIIVSAAGSVFAADTTSTQAKLQYNKGVDFYRLGEYDKSITAFRQAIAIDPNYTDAYYNLGSILEFIKQDEAALTVFKQIIVRNPTDYESVYKAAEISARLGKTDAAKQYLSIIPQSHIIYSKAQALARSLNTDIQTIKQQQKQATAKQAAEKKTASTPVTQNGIFQNLGSPTGVATDSKGNLFVAGFSDNAVYKIAPDGSRKLYVKDARIKGPIGIDIDEQNNLYLANYNADNVLKISNSGQISVLIASVKKPYCIHIKDNNLFVSSQGTNSVIRYKL